MAESLSSTARYLEALPDLRICADFSHFTCVSEGREWLTINPEFGPYPYQPCDPHTPCRYLGGLLVDDPTLSGAVGRLMAESLPVLRRIGRLR